MPDHFEQQWFAVGPAVVAAACATSTLRVGCLVYGNNFRHPALLAREAATVDVLSDGRLEFGIGAGYYLPEYSQTGITLPLPRDRVQRLGEAIAGLRASGRTGRSLSTGCITRSPRWTARRSRCSSRTRCPGWRRGQADAHPGGKGGRIVGIIARSAQAGGLHFGRDTDALVGEKVGWVREAAGDRFDQLELAVLIWQVVITDYRRSTAEDVGPRWGMTAEQVLASPYFLVGSPEAIVEDVQALRERHGISYMTVFPGDVDSFAPVVAQLAGT